jgi:hypothetical protein
MRPTIVAHLPQHSWEVLVRLPLAQLLQASTGERQKERGILAVGAYAYESKGEGGGDGGGTQTKNLEQLEHITQNITLKKKREKKTQASKKGTSSSPQNKTTSSTPSSLPSPTTQGTSWEETSLVGS